MERNDATDGPGARAMEIQDKHIRNERGAIGLTITPLGGPTTLIDVAGLRFLVDPTFDEPGFYPLGDRGLTKTQPAARSAREIGSVDAVLLSHDQHPDNLDAGGREFVQAAPLTLTTPLAAERLGGTAIGLTPWQTRQLTSAAGDELVVTAVPALHGPEGCEDKTGPVTGFVLSGATAPTVYVSGDNASLALVAEIADHFSTVDVAVLFAGAAQTPLLPDTFLTLTSDQAAEAAVLLGTPWVVAAHTDGWEHFSQGLDSFQRAFDAAGLADRLLGGEPGVEVNL